MAPRPRSRSEYTVGWVCSLPKEQTAAVAMLDQIHPDLDNQSSHDDNTYTLGSMGKHNIVIACLPKGRYGTNSAATAASQMVNTFPSIKVGLMVGVGGGIPPKVRLGDVVVSVPVDQYPGVVQWDLGKTEKGGKFKRTGALNNPPRALLTALAKLETRHEMNGSKIHQYLEELAKKYPRLVPKYTRPVSLEDPLVTAYNSSNDLSKWYIIYSTLCEMFLALLGYLLGRAIFTAMDSKSERTTGNTSANTAVDTYQENCEDVRVHYGLIASGNNVVKDAKQRDNLNKSLGGNVLCIEMEAAGLMDDFPCIVIRGICNYADSRKNKNWQEYAAATAAGCAKELLECVQPGDVHRERPVKDILDKVLHTVSRIDADVENVRSKLDRKEDIGILQWLSPIDYGIQQSDFINRRQPETGQWLLGSETYKEWLNARGKTLFCPGIPGSGKTILTSIVIDNITRIMNHQTVGIAYLYCNFKRQDEQTLDSLLRNLLKQLAQSQSPLPHDLKDLYDRAKRTGIRPSLDDISRVLQSISALYSQAFIVVDALDECQTSGGCLSTLLSRIFALQDNTGINFFATSRHITDIERRFEGCLTQEVLAINGDVRRYMEGHMVHLPSFIRNKPHLREEISNVIRRAADGMFLLAQLYLDSLADKTSVTEMRNALKILKRSQQELGERKNGEVNDMTFEIEESIN